MDITDLATIGARIVELGLKLKSKKAEREAIDKVISDLEAELMPLVAEHAKLIASVVGPPPQPVQVQAPRPPNVPVNGPQVVVQEQVVTPTKSNDVIKKRVLDYIQRSDHGGSATEIAEALRLDPLDVRQAMSELARGR